jgi:flagellar biogenesis protein FliO
MWRRERGAPLEAIECAPPPAAESEPPSDPGRPRPRPRWLATAGAAIALIAGGLGVDREATAAPPPPTANGALSLPVERPAAESARSTVTPAPPIVEPAIPAPAPEPVAPALPADEAADAIEVAAAAPSATVETSPRETASLGRPNGPLSARPAQGPRDDAPGGMLARLDPTALETGRVLAALGVVIMIIMVLRAAARRIGPASARAGRPSGVVEILARYPVARGQQLVLLKLARRVLLVHQSGAAMTTLSEMTDRDEVAAVLARVEAGSRQKDQARFGRILRRFESDHDRQAARAPGASPAGGVPPFETEIVDLTRGRRARGRAARAAEGAAS